MTEALKAVLRYVFLETDIPSVFADALKTNVRSRHALEKAGFTRVGENAEYVFYRIDRQRNAEEETGSEAFGEPFVRSGDPSMEDA
ncbi:MAG: GNAT family N-acetyltransferase [Clostridia bacterium]|nr:GNAT family N-acetyltransferase [Clostridia bacterium]